MQEILIFIDWMKALGMLFIIIGHLEIKCRIYDFNYYDIF